MLIGHVEIERHSSGARSTKHQGYSPASKALNWHERGRIKSVDNRSEQLNAVMLHRNAVGWISSRKCQ